MANTPLDVDYHSARNNSMSRRGSGQLVVQRGAGARIESIIRRKIAAAEPDRIRLSASKTDGKVANASEMEVRREKRGADPTIRHGMIIPPGQSIDRRCYVDF
jgi:hypothetical protein